MMVSVGGGSTVNGLAGLGAWVDCSNPNRGTVTDAYCMAQQGVVDYWNFGWGTPGYMNPGETLTTPPVQQAPGAALTNPNAGNLDAQTAAKWKEQWSAWSKSAFGAPNSGSGGGSGDGALLSSLIGILLVAGIAMYFLQRNR